MRTITLNMIDRSQYDENETGTAIETTLPVDIDVDWVRSYNPRKGGRTGTRITFKDRGGFAVSETFEQVRAALQGTPAPATPADATVN